jgi:hypothetical protein
VTRRGVGAPLVAPDHDAPDLSVRAVTVLQAADAPQPRLLPAAR